MTTLAETTAHLEEAGVSALDIQRVSRAWERAVITCAGKPLDKADYGVAFYEGHLPESPDLEGCPPFHYIWVRFELGGGFHYAFRVKLVDGYK
jgi:hypothetical protein